MKRTLKEEVRSLERYLGLAPDPRRDRLLELLEAADPSADRPSNASDAPAAYNDSRHDDHAKA